MWYWTTDSRTAASPNATLTPVYHVESPEVAAYLESGGVISDCEMLSVENDLEYLKDVERAEIVNEALDLFRRQALERVAEDARNANAELFSNTAPADPLGDALERQRIANARLLHKDDDLNPQAPSDWDMDGQGVVEAMPAVSNVPPEIAALLDEGETLTRDVRRKLTERLNVELAELKNLRGLAGEDLKREAEIEKLLGLFARLGEI